MTPMESFNHTSQKPVGCMVTGKMERVHSRSLSCLPLDPASNQLAEGRMAALEPRPIFEIPNGGRLLLLYVESLYYMWIEK